MRVVMFYSGVESFNYFTDRIAHELEMRGDESFILDITNMQGAAGHSLTELTKFIDGGVDLVISYDGFGMKEDMFIELWNSLDVRCANILMDHPLRFHETMSHHPRRYIQFCCDKKHVVYVKSFFAEEVPFVHFLPHAGTLPEKEPDINETEYKNRPYDILFSGTYYRPEKTLENINQWFEKGSMMDMFYRELYEYMCAESALSVEEAALKLIGEKKMDFSADKLKTVLRCLEPVDWSVRMYNRGETVKRLADAGFDIWLLGRGWEDHTSCGALNFHILSDRVPFEETFGFMSKARINLNVMPHFKAGSHDRIFNVYLQGSLPLTDTSEFLNEAYGDELPRFALDDIGGVVQIAGELLSDTAGSIEKIKAGYKKTAENYVWKNIVDELLKMAEEV